MGLDRIEQKIDRIMDDQVEMKISMVQMSSSLKETSKALQDHICQDEKVISRLHPMIEDFEFRKKKREERLERAKEFALKAVYITIPVSVIGTILKIVLS